MIEPAYRELASVIADALVGAGFLPAAADLEIDPSAPFTPTGDERTLVHAAALVTVETNPVRQILGRSPRFVVERRCQLELAAAGPDRLRRENRIEDALLRLALLPTAYPTLSGTAERLVLLGQTDDDLPPNGVAFTLTFTLRVRSGDPLGRTP